MRVLVLTDAAALQLANLLAALAPMKVGAGLDHGVPKEDIKLFQELRNRYASGERVIIVRQVRGAPSKEESDAKVQE